MPYKEFTITGVGTVKVYKRRGIKSLKLTIPASGLVRVTIPAWASYTTGLHFVTSKLDWIREHNVPDKATLTHGQQIGKAHQLIFQPQSASGVKTRVRNNKIVVSYCARSYAATDETVQTAAQSACWRALRKQAEQLFAHRLSELAERHGFHYRSLSVKRLKSRWGSCDAHGNIVLNLFLVQLPWELIDYVIVHELSHTVALNHGDEFWHRFEQALPDARIRRKAMRAYRPELMLVEK